MKKGNKIKFFRVLMMKPAQCWAFSPPPQHLAFMTPPL